MNQDEINPERKRRVVRLPLGEKVVGHRLKFNFRRAAHAWTRNSDTRSSGQRSRLRDNCGRAVRIFRRASGEAAQIEAVPFKIDEREGGFIRRGGVEDAGVEFEIGDCLAVRRQRWGDPKRSLEIGERQNCRRGGRGEGRRRRKSLAAGLYRAWRRDRLQDRPEYRLGLERRIGEPERAHHSSSPRLRVKKSTRVAATSALALARAAASRAAIGLSTRSSTARRSAAFCQSASKIAASRARSASRPKIWAYPRSPPGNSTTARVTVASPRLNGAPSPPA